MKLLWIGLCLVLTLSGCALLDRDARGEGDAEHLVSAQREGRDEAELVIVSGATTVAVVSEDIGDDLYRISTPDDSRLRPAVVRVDDRFEVHLENTELSGPAAVRVRLHPEVAWRVRLAGGATESLLDLGSGRVAGVEFSAGSSRIELTLPKPSGTVVVRMSGGASDFLIHAPQGVPVLVRAGGGAGSVTVDGQRRTGLAGGTVVDAQQWDSATDRYEIDAVAGVSNLQVDRVSPR
jgi:hypothetical protein